MSTTTITTAMLLAHELHGQQKRKVSLVADVSYEAHLMEVAALIMMCGGDEMLVAAAFLHDAIEDQGVVTRSRILKELGPNVLALVDACTEIGANSQSTKDPWYFRKAAYLQHIADVSLPVLLLIIADKLQSAGELARTLRWITAHQGSGAQVKIWSQFGGGQVGTLWFHKHLVEVLRHRLRQLQQENPLHPLLPGCESLLDELIATVEVLLTIAQKENAMKLSECNAQAQVPVTEAPFSITQREWTIYPSGFEDRFALGFPDGRLLREGEFVELLLDESWHVGWIEYGYHSGARFVAYSDKSTIGLCAAMKVRLPVLQLQGGHDE